MKKIIVLGLLFLSHALPIVSAEENPIFALMITGITLLSFKVATDKLKQSSHPKSTFIAYESANVIDSQELDPCDNINTCSINPIKYQKRLVGTIPQDLPLVAIASLQCNDRYSSKKAVRGLQDAKRDELHVPYTDCISSVFDVDAISTNSIQKLVKNYIPFPIFKKNPEQAFITKTMLQSATTSLDLRSVSPDDYHNIDRHALSPQKGFTHDHEEDGFVVIVKK